MTAGGLTITQDYVSSGQKYKKYTTGGDEPETRFYLNGSEWVNGLPQTYNFGDGRIYWEETSPGSGELASHVQYRLTDHLGNSMVVFEDKGEADGELLTELDTDDPEELEVIQRLWYYPFGMHMDGIGQQEATPNSDYRYNGKEYDEATGLYDYGARYYDPAIARWGQVDPLADQFGEWSPYSYVFNNPLIFVDPDGMAPEWIDNGDGTYTAEAGDSAYSLAKDAGLSNAYANQVVESQLGANYIGADGGLKSNVEVGDVVNVGNRGYSWSSGESETTQIASTNSTSYSTSAGSDGVSVGSISDGIGGFGQGMATQGGTFRVTNGSYNGNSLSVKHYASGWGGGSRAGITTHSMTGVGKTLGKIGTGGTVIIGAIDVRSNYIREGGFGTHTQQATGRATGSLLGSSGGAYIGAGVGSFFGGVGAVPGGIIGGLIGGYGGSTAGEQVVKKIQEN